jgi:hypothetical protein
MILDKEVDNDQADIDAILLTSLDNNNIWEMSWLPIHFAIALNARNKISENDIHVLLFTDPLAMHRLSFTKDDELDEERLLTGCSTTHILLMQKQPTISLVRFFCIRDPRAFASCDQSGRCALHLVAQYSERVELL